MTDEQKIRVIQDATGEGDNDLIEAYLSMATEAVLDRLYPCEVNLEDFDVPSKYDSVVIECAVYLLNKRGAEGQISHSEVGTSRSYESASIPASMLRRVTPFVRVLGG